MLLNHQNYCLKFENKNKRTKYTKKLRPSVKDKNKNNNCGHKLSRPGGPQLN